MIIYLVTFFMSIILISIGYIFDKKYKLLKWLFVIIGLLLPCLLAANRAISIGSDTKGYVTYLYNLALKVSNIKNYFIYSKTLYLNEDYAYLIMTYVIAKLTGNFKLLLFFAQFLTITPIFIALDKNKDSPKEVIFGMIIYYLFMYNVSLNMVRQSIAISISILGLYYLQKDKKIPSIILLILAFGFHRTEFIMIPIYILCALSNRKVSTSKEGKIKKVYKLIYIISIIFVIEYKDIIYFLYKTGIYEHGILYIQKYQKFDFSFIDTITYLLFIILYINSKKIVENKSINYEFYKFMGIESIILLQLGAFIQYMERVSFFLFYPFLLYSVPKIISTNAKNKSINSYTLLTLGYFIFYWIVVFGIMKMHETVPYKFG